MRRASRLLGRLFFYLLVVFVVVYSVFPFYWAVISSFKPSDALFSPDPSFLPVPFTLEHYENVFLQANFGRNLLNSLIVAGGATLLAAGDMGIGNTTAAAALTAALLGLPPEAVVGRGTGVGEEGLRRKRQAVARALARLHPGMGPLEVAAEVGGLELVAIAGIYLEGYEAGLPLVLDGFPVTAGAPLAWKMAPGLRDHLFAGHLSREPGHRHQLEALGLRPLLDLDLALGEGTGAVLAMPLLRAAARILHMATFQEAGVSRG